MLKTGIQTIKLKIKNFNKKMRTINACLIIIFAIIGLTKSIDFSNLSEIQELKQSSFASSLIETISLTLTANKGNDATDVLKMLSDLQSQLDKDQLADDAVFNSKKGEFDRHIQQLRTEINKLKVEIDALIKRIADLTLLINTATKNIASFNNRMTTLRMEVTKITEDYARDSKYLGERIQSLVRVQQTLLRVVVKLNALVGSIAGRNQPKHVREVAAETRDRAFAAAAAARKKSFLQADELPESFAELELTLNADQNALNKLKALINKLANDVFKKKVGTVKYLAETKATFEMLTVSYAREIALNQSALLKQTKNKQLYEGQRANAENEKARKLARKASLKKEKALNKKLLADLVATHTREAADRKTESDIVRRLINIVTTRLVRK